MCDQAAVFFELFLTRTAHADAALVPRQVRPHPFQPGHRVLELRKLNLEMGLMGSSMSREDVENNLGPVDDLDLEGSFEISRLSRSQVVIEDDHVGLVGLHQFLELLDLARANIGGDVDLLPLLQHGGDDMKASRLCQPANLVKRVVLGRVVIGKNNPDKDGTFRTSQTLSAF